MKEIIGLNLKEAIGLINEENYKIVEIETLIGRNNKFSGTLRNKRIVRYKAINDKIVRITLMYF